MVIISRFFVGKYPKFLISEARELVIQDVSIVGQTKLKPRVPLCWLFYLCVIDLILFVLKLSLIQYYF